LQSESLLTLFFIKFKKALASPSVSEYNARVIWRVSLEALLSVEMLLIFNWLQESASRNKDC